MVNPNDFDPCIKCMYIHTFCVYSAYHGHLKSLKAITSHPLSGPDTADYAHIVCVLACSNQQWCTDNYQT